jgi:hypothetical protein
MRIVNTTHEDGAMTVVHKVGCADVKKDMKYGPIDTMDVESLQEVAYNVFSDQIEEGSMDIHQAVDELHVRSCALDLPMAAPKKLTRIDVYADEMARRLNSTEQSIRTRVAQMRSRLDRIESYLDADQNLNELGELQGSGGELDRLIAVRQTLATALVGLDWANEQDKKEAN